VDIQKFLEQAGIREEIITDGTIHRYDGASPGSGWYVAHKRESGATIITAGDWASGRPPRTFKTDNLTPEDEEFFALQEHQERLKTESIWQETASRAASDWRELPLSGFSRYCDQKKISPVGCRFLIKDGETLLVVPVTDIQGNIQGWQTISQSGFKSFLTGTKVRDHMHSLPGDSSTIYVTEGYATAATVNAATGCATYLAFNAGNLLSVCKQVKDAFPDSTVILAADNDHQTAARTGTNPGLKYAAEVKAKLGINYIYPHFESTDPGSDWNDIHCASSLETVKNQIEAALARAGTWEPQPLTRMVQGRDGTKQPKPPSEQQIVEAILENMGDSLRAYGGTLFYYTGGKWRLTSDYDHHGLYAVFEKLSGDTMTNSRLEALRKYLTKKATKLKQGDIHGIYDRAHFQDGTLEIKRVIQNGTSLFEPVFTAVGAGDKGAFTLSRLPHSYSTIASNLKPSRLLDAIGRMTGGSKDATDAIQEAFACALVPLFPRIFFLTGPTATGKSLLLRLVTRLVTEENLSFCEPHNMTGFSLEAMAGKLVNISSDISTSRPIPTDKIKRIVDRMPVEINRKYEKNLYLPLPPVHMYACNDLPNIEGERSDALQRRVSIIETSGTIPDADRVTDYDEVIWHEEADAILSWSLAGLKRLCSTGGRFTSIGQDTLNSIADESDPVRAFWAAIRDGEVPIVGATITNAGGALFVERGLIRNHFLEWCKAQNTRNIPGRNTLYRYLEKEAGRVVEIENIKGFKIDCAVFPELKYRDSVSQQF